MNESVQKSNADQQGSASIEDAFEIARIDLVYRQNIVGIAALLVYSLTYVSISWTSVSHVFLVTWLMVLLTSATLRIVATYRWYVIKERLGAFSAASAQPWLRFLKVMLLISGLGWGVAGFELFLGTSVYQQLITALIILFMAGGAIVCYAASLTAVNLVTIPALSGLVLVLLTSHRPELVLMGVLTFLFSLLGILSSRTLSRYVKSSLRLNVDNAHLAQRLLHQINTREQAQAALDQSQSRLELAMDCSNAFMWEWDPAANCMTTHEGTQRFEKYLERFHPDDRSRFQGLLAETTTCGLALDDEFCLLADRAPSAAINAADCTAGGASDSLSDGDGNVYFAFKGRPQKNRPLGASAKVTGICWDVTSKRNQEETRRQRDIFDAENKAKSVFLANASHEIRTPLASINGYAEILLQAPNLPFEIRDDLRTILRNGKYLFSLVNDLLDLSANETDRLFLQKVRLSLSQEIEDAVLVVKSSIEAKRLRLEVLFEEGLPEHFESDPVRFRQILINLLTNAVKFTDQGSIELRVAFYKTASQPGAHGRLQISVTDSGIGLSSAEQERLFQPFVRGDSHAARKTPGTGLGLALSQKLARRLGGDLQLVRSSLGQGSEFAFHLDIEPASQGTEVAPPFETHPVETHAHQQDVHGISALQGARILLVEDAVDLRVLIQRYLSKHGAMIELCENGFDAVERAMKQSFDLILMDMKMPVMDGYEAARTLRQRGYRHPIVALTAYANTSDRQRCFEAGCDDYISKPIDPQHLIHHLARQLSKRVQSSITDESRN